MTKKQKSGVGFLIVSILVAWWFVNNFVPKQDATALSEDKPSIFTEIKQHKPLTPIEENLAAESISAKLESKPEHEFKAQLEKCFPESDLKNVTKENLISYFERKANLSNPRLELEHYELRTKEAKQVVVQMIPGEEPKDQVRVFSISEEDGLPDRIHEFPNAKSEIAERIKGALTLGELVQKNETTQQQGALGELLEIEKFKDKVLRIRYSEPDLDFSCDNAKCECFKLTK